MWRGVSNDYANGLTVCCVTIQPGLRVKKKGLSLAKLLTKTEVVSFLNAINLFTKIHNIAACSSATITDRHTDR